MKKFTKSIKIALVCILFSSAAFAQTTDTIVKTKATIGILNIDTKGLSYDSESVSYMVRLEAEKANVYTVMDRYDMADVIKKTGIDITSCYGKVCLVDAGKKLNAAKMLSGNVERFGDKVVITLRLIDVKSETVEKSQVMEFLNLDEEVQKMIFISINKLFGVEVDQNLVDLLVDYENPIVSPTTTLNLNGPRMGVSFITGDAAKILRAPKSEGGFEMSPVTSQFGFQLEKQYLSAGNFQALIEFVGLVGGLESGKFIPSVAFMNGFRINSSGWEFAFGPVFKVVKVSQGYYADQAGGDGKWHESGEWSSADSTGNFVANTFPAANTYENPNDIIEQLDSRGHAKLKTSLVLAVGKTFKSGYMNIPVNVYVIPNKKGTVIGMSFGFNINQMAKNR